MPVQKIVGAAAADDDDDNSDNNSNCKQSTSGSSSKINSHCTRTGTRYIVHPVVIHKVAARWLEWAERDTAQW